MSPITRINLKIRKRVRKTESLARVKRKVVRVKVVRKRRTREVLEPPILQAPVLHQTPQDHPPARPLHHRLPLRLPPVAKAKGCVVANTDPSRYTGVPLDQRVVISHIIYLFIRKNQDYSISVETPDPIIVLRGLHTL